VDVLTVDEKIKKVRGFAEDLRRQEKRAISLPLAEGYPLFLITVREAAEILEGILNDE